MENPDESPTIALLDSLYTPSQEFKNRYTVGRTVDILNDPNTPETLPDDTTGHGRTVLHLLCRIAQNAQYNFYRITRQVPRGEILDRDMLKGIYEAHCDGVDVINISAGNDHVNSSDYDCDAQSQPCSICDAANQAISDGITVVSGAGNKPGFESVCCPSLSDEVISVGGFVSECKARIDKSNPISLAGRHIKPPGAYWLNRSDGKGPSQAYCSAQKCGLGMECKDYQYNHRWDKNVDSVGEKPDIHAPVHWLAGSKDGPMIYSGTSYSTPVVSAILSNIISICREVNVELSARETYDGVVQSGERLDDRQGMRLSGRGIFNHLDEEHDISSGDNTGI